MNISLSRTVESTARVCVESKTPPHRVELLRYRIDISRCMIDKLYSSVTKGNVQADNVDSKSGSFYPETNRDRKQDDWLFFP